MDRRRVNGPPGGTAPPCYASASSGKTHPSPKRTRGANEIRKICEYSLALHVYRNSLRPYTDIRNKNRPQDRSDTLRFWVCLFRARNPSHQPQQLTYKPNPSFEIDLHGSRPSTSSTIRTLLAPYSTFRSRQICTFRSKTTQRLHS